MNNGQALEHMTSLGFIRANPPALVEGWMQCVESHLIDGATQTPTAHTELVETVIVQALWLLLLLSPRRCIRACAEWSEECAAGPYPHAR